MKNASSMVRHGAEMSKTVASMMRSKKVALKRGANAAGA